MMPRFLISATAVQKMQLVATFLGIVLEGDPPTDAADTTICVQTPKYPI